jgi:hypothetical protein
MIKATDLAYGRLGAPDLDRMEEFLVDFGMVRADRTKKALYMRGTDGDHHHIHVTELGEPTHIGLAWWASSEDDLEIISKVPGASEIHEIDEPGGGKRVNLTDPDGRTIEIIHGMKTVEDLDVRDVAINTGNEKYKRMEIQRLSINPGQPSHVKRSAHAVVKTPDLKKFNEWYQSTLGLMKTDAVKDFENENEDMMTFNHIDAGENYVDHHVLRYSRNTQNLTIFHLRPLTSMMFKLVIIGCSQKDISTPGGLVATCSEARYLITGVTPGVVSMNIGQTAI